MVFLNTRASSIFKIVMADVNGFFTFLSNPLSNTKQQKFVQII